MKLKFCSGSKTSSRAAEGSPCGQAKDSYPIVAAKLVNLVQHNHRIIAANLPEAGQNPARHGGHVSTSVSTNICFIPHSAQSNSLVAPAIRREGNRPKAAAILFPRDVLPTPGGPTRQIMAPRPLGENF